MNTINFRIRDILLFVIAGVCASILMYWITAQGAGVSLDSIRYIETASSLLKGNGFSFGGKPVSIFPPGYPFLLSIVGFFQDGNVRYASRLLCAIFFGVNFILLGIAVFLCTERSWLAVLSVMCVFLCSAPVISIHSMAWTEAPFVIFFLVGLILLSLYIARPNIYLLLFASFSAGCAIATRYVGVALLPPFICGLLFISNRQLKHKIIDVLIAIFVIMFPIATWLIRNIMIAETATSRTFAVHIISFDHVKQFITSMCEFVLPVSILPISGTIKEISRGIVGLLFLFVAIYFIKSLTLLYRKNYIKRYANTITIIFPCLCIIFFFSYISFLVISISFFDAATPLDTRIILPGFLIITIVIISWVWALSSALNSKKVWHGFIFLILISAIINSVRAITVAIDIHKNGRQFTSRRWQTSETIFSVASFANDVKIYSNWPEVIQFFTGRTGEMIPYVVFPLTNNPNINLEEELQIMCREVEKGTAIVVYFTGIAGRLSSLPSIMMLDEKCAMPLFSRLNDGVIYARF